MHKIKQIKIMITKETPIYNQFNDSQLSDELSNYILEQFRGIPLKTDVTLNICSNFKMTKAEKNKIVNEIRENYGLDIKENLLKLKFAHLKQIFILFIGLILILISHLLTAEYYYLLSQFLSIFGWVMVYECVSSFVFFNTKIRYQNIRYVKLIKSKIIFTEPEEETKA